MSTNDDAQPLPDDSTHETSGSNDRKQKVPPGQPDALQDSQQASSGLSIDSLTVHAGDHCLLQDVQASLPAGKITLIVGSSGAGKSVLLRILAGLVGRQSGSLRWEGTITKTDNQQEPQIGIVFQQFALFDELSPQANVQFALDHRFTEPQRDQVPPTQTDNEASSPSSETAFGHWPATQWIDHLGVPGKTPVAHLSGGQKQRVAVARTLAASPDVILYDEPTSGLDSSSGALVANLIQQIQQQDQKTCIVVTHDYQTLLPIADHVLLLDWQSKQLVPLRPEQWQEIPNRMTPVANKTESATSTAEQSLGKQAAGKLSDFFESSGRAVMAAARLPVDLIPLVPRPKWAFRFTAHYLRLVAGPSAWVYLIIAGLIIGFTSTYFTFKFLPFRSYSQPLLIDELLASIGFALYRVLVPILATILIAARCGSAVAADVSVKQYGGQVDAMRTLGVLPKSYLLLPIVCAFLIGTPLLEWVTFASARFISMVVYVSMFPNDGPYFWQQYFDRNLVAGSASETVSLFGIIEFYRDWQWVQAKNLFCALGIATISYYRGLTPKRSAGDVSRSITSTVLWTTLYVLVVHFVVALVEF
ncbi:Glutamine transport ATP-binding protein GlnQ [Stieleria bergensis]|uniref:Glutamine transport ATP-binding protein GlnQ n=1 Tax=Stieleria bergensis TaxID=2528025 RepID=A0A517SYM6_9BACT|nr:Glutamine transport ATP-binding protein GlnQ [Planctomycetes bacterium SV_7m_r]